MGAGGDDFWLPGKVKTQIEFMERNLDFGVCYGKAQTCDELGNDLNNIIGAGYENYRKLIEIGNNIPALTACFRHDLFNGYLKEISPQSKNWLMEDYPFWIYCAYNTNIHFFDTAFGVYSVRQESESHSLDKMKCMKFEQSINDIVCFYSEKFNVTLPVKITKKHTFLHVLSFFFPYGILVLYRIIKMRIKKITEVFVSVKVN